MSIKARVTLQDIANVAGCSRMAVSLALRDSQEVSAATRARVKALAAKMGYVPDPDLAGLVAYRLGKKSPEYRATIAAVRTWKAKQQERMLANPNYDYLVGAARQAEQLGYRIEEFVVGGDGLSVARFPEVARARNIRGVLVMPLLEPLGLLNLPWDDFTVVAFGHTVTRPALHRVTSYHYRSMVTTLRKLKGLGYRRIGMATLGFIDDRVGNGYLAAYLAEHQRWLRREPIPPYMPRNSRDWNAARFRDWIKTNRVDAIVSANRDIHSHLAEIGLSAPGDVGCAGLSVPSLSGPESGIYEDAPLIGSVAVEQLVAQLYRNERGVPEFPQTVLVEGKWVEGGTLRRVDRVSLPGKAPVRAGRPKSAQPQPRSRAGR